jgi:uncharacterized protein YnzC (UPF0291/DUF896 family)
MSKELIERINELAHKKKTEGLTAEEKSEQQELYKIYLKSVRQQVTTQLENAGINKKGNGQHVCHDGCCEHHHHGPDCGHNNHKN